MKLHHRIESIRTRQDLASFVRALRADVQEHPEKWENATLDPFLESMAAWIDDMDGCFRNRGELVPEPPTWRLFGEILYAAGIYE
jgi:hypothetical protein